MITVLHSEPSSRYRGRAYLYVDGRYIGSLIFPKDEDMNEVMGHLQDGRAGIEFKPIEPRR